MRRWFLLALTAALVTAAVVAAVAAAGGTDVAAAWGERGVGTVDRPDPDADGQARGGAAWRSCGEDAFRAGPAFGLLEDPEARAEAEALRERHRAEMREWRERHGEDSRGEEAQEALQALREQHRAQFRALFEKYGLELPEGARLGGDGRGCGMSGAADSGSRTQGHGRGRSDRAPQGS